MKPLENYGLAIDRSPDHFRSMNKASAKPKKKAARWTRTIPKAVPMQLATRTISATWISNPKPMTVSEAKPRLGALLDGVAKGEQVLLKRHDRLYRIEIVEVPEPIPVRPVGYFDCDGPDEMADLHNSALVSYPPR